MVGVQKLQSGKHSHGTTANHRVSSRDGPSRTVPPLPMPPRRLQALYSNSLFANSSSNNADNDSNDNPSVLDYLTKTRGLTPATLRKYGVGKAQYSFANDNGSYTKQDCVTFSWIMSLRDAQVQEELRGSKLNLQDYLPATPVTAGAAGTLEPANTDDTTTKAPSMDEILDQTFVTRRIKARSLTNKACQRLDPPGGAWGFFGYHTIPSNAKEVVLCEGEYDAMAVWQATGRPAISLPNGCRSLPVETLPMLEEFDRIYLWMDNDGPGQEGAELFSKKLGLERCYIVRPSKQNIGIDPSDFDNKLPKDANEALLMGCSLESILSDAKLTPHEQILTFDELRVDVLHEIMHPDQYVGTPMTSLPMVTSKIKGLRRGELTVLTGPTGSGYVERRMTRNLTSLYKLF
jgi:twinkle protein